MALSTYFDDWASGDFVFGNLPVAEGMYIRRPRHVQGGLFCI